MKRMSFTRCVLACGSMGLVVAAGCQALRLPIVAALAPSIGSFTTQAGVPVSHSGAVNINNSSGVTVGSGTIGVSASAITVTANGPGKQIALQQATSTLTVTVRVAPIGDRESVCEIGETYGPFEVTLDASLVPIAVEPSSVSLTPTTIDLLNAEEFSLCLVVVSPVDGTVTISSLAFDLGL